ncbi:MAG: nuclear transport factor 2 family protein [Actinobacteria bacterium]|nr:MAG: nuclear transport factor 2 family protein [Actinomycetota bacterium]
MVSSRKLALAEQFIELTRARDWSRLELLSDDVVYRPIEQITETGQYVGREGFRSYMEGFTESGWASSVDVGAATFLQVGDAVIVRIELAVRGRASGMQLAGRVFEVLHFDRETIVRVEDFLDREDALRAAERPR